MLEPTPLLNAGPLTLALQDGALPNAVPGIGQGGGAPAGTGTGQETPLGTGAPVQGPGGFGNTITFMMLGLLGFMILSIVMSSRREKKRTAEMLSGLKRGDRVITTAGMFGTVHEVKPDAVVLRIDEVSGTKAQFSKNAVQRIVKPAKGDKTAEDNADTEPVAAS